MTVWAALEQRAVAALQGESVGQRLQRGFVAVLALIFVVTGVGLAGLLRAAADARHLEQRELVALSEAHAVREEVLLARRYEKDVLLSLGAPDRQAAHLARWREVVAALQKRLDALQALDRGGDWVRDVSAMRSDVEAYRRGAEPSLLQAQGASLSPVEANALLAPFEEPLRRLSDETSPRFASRHAAEVRRLTADVTTWTAAAGGVMAVLAVVAALASAVVGRIFTRSVTEPLADAVQLASRISQGDLTGHVEATSRDEAGQLVAAVGRMADNLRAMIAEVKGGSNNVASASSQILAATRRSVQGAQQEAAAVQETTATASQLQQTVRVTEERTREIQEVMSRTARSNQSIRAQLTDAADSISRIHQEMATLVASIQDLSRRNVQIGEIVESIGEVADQTQLLAVNAGIEAAKAGDVGRGFSVVAAEMKALADQTKKASQRIRTIVREVEEAAHGTTRVVEAGQARLQEAVRPVGEVVPMVERLTGEVDESNQSLRQILAIVSQQVAGIAEITRAMNTIQSTVQEGLARNQELERGAEGLDRLGNQLRAVVQGYRV